MRTVNTKINGLNSDQVRRDEILGIDYHSDYLGGTESFVGLTIDELNQLLRENFIDPYDRQNDSPTVDEFREFLTDHPEVTAHGYAVDKKRNDYRVSIEGIEFTGPVSIGTMLDFVKLCRYADEFECTQNRLRAWWD